MITRHRFMPLFAVALCFARPLPAFADQTEVTVMQPPGIDLATLKEVLTDPKPSIGGGVATVAALALWSAIGNILVHTEMCQNANTALGDATHHQFSVKTNVVTVGGGVKEGALVSTLIGAKEPRWSQTDEEPGPPLKTKVTGRFRRSAPSRV